MSSSFSGRTRTPSDLKWLLNERAAIAGQIGKAQARLQFLDAKVAALQVKVEILQCRSQSVRSTMAERQTTLSALSTAIGLAYERVRPDAAGVVNAWAGKYGHHGALKQRVAHILQEAAPSAVTTSVVVAKVIEHFSIPILCPADRRVVRKSIANIFQQLLACGRLEALHARVRTGTTGTWRWKEPIPSLSDLAAKAHRMAQAAAEANDAGPNPVDHPGSAR